MADASPSQQAPMADTTPQAPLEPETLPQSQEDSILSSSSQPQDGEKHPKGKRKRTAAKDKSILEDAYCCNPKPDKQARLDIVERVSLNEKEVQIWFQNRRQNDRRKSRPLSAEEVASMRYAGTNPFSSDPVTVASMYGLPPSSDPVSAENSFYSSPAQPANSASLPQHAHSDVTSTPLQVREEVQAHYGAAEAVAPVGYLANRWNLGSSFSTPSSAAQADDPFRRASFNGSTCSPDTSLHSTQSQSNVRLSLSLEGKAELVTAGLSPDRIPSVDLLPPRAALQRSQSAITLPPVSTLLRATDARRPSMRGRSRDVAAWVSAAHADTHDELTAQAENESTGSAIAAISLLRSTSGSVLQTSGSAKRNASVSRTQPEPAKKRKFNRAISSIARLETVGGDLKTPAKESPMDKLKVSRLLSPTDSDKENLSPDEDGVPRVRRPLPSVAAASQGSTNASSKPPHPRRTGGRVLQENGISLLNSRSNTAPARHRGGKGDSGIDIFEDDGKKAGAGKGGKQDDVDKFMRGEVSPSKKPDMDCVAGLLSLSQGAWR